MIVKALNKVIDGVSLDVDESEAVMTQIMTGACPPTQLAALLVGLRMKGETLEEILGFARAMRAASVAVTAPDDAIDTCGTGGDFSNSFNISTASAIVAAGAGITVAKHGNRSATSKCGSADVLEALGVRLVVTPEQAERCLRHVGLSFLFAPAFHPAMKHAATVRTELNIRTVFNILGPLASPARIKRQVLGVPRPELGPRMAAILAGLDSEHALIVHGQDGLDEISLSEATTIHELRSGAISSYRITPEDLGLTRADRNTLVGGDVEENAAIIHSLLGGEKGPKRDALLANAAAALVVGRKAGNLKEGVELAATVIDSGSAKEKLSEFVAFTQALGD